MDYQATLLVVEHDSGLRREIVRLCRLHIPQAKVFQSDNVHHAYKTFKEVEPDLVIMEAELPTHEGSEQLDSRLPSMLRILNKRTPLLLFTGETGLQEDLSLFYRIISKQDTSLLSGALRDFGQETRDDIQRKGHARPKDSSKHLVL